MTFLKVGYTFKSKTGKSTVLLLNIKDLKLIHENMKKNVGKNGEDYGLQASLLISGDLSSKFGHSIALIKLEDENAQDNQKNYDENEIDPDSIPL